MTAKDFISKKPSLDERIVEKTPDEVEASSLDSFPASDPPSWTPIIGSGAPSLDRKTQERDTKGRSRASSRVRGHK